MSNPGASEGFASAEGHADLVNDLETEMQNLALQPSIVDSLSPEVKKRVLALQELQEYHDEIEQNFFEERAALEAKYQKLYEPLYSKTCLQRYGIVNGIVDVQCGENQNDLPDNNAAEEKGVPKFWLTAMKTNVVLAEQITDHDEGALEYLKDIKWYRIDDPKGFKLEFYFNTNPYFKNSMLAKTYHMIDEDEPILERAIGTDIEWFPGRNLTEKVMKENPKKGVKNGKPATKTEQCESFFNFFYPPEMPEHYNELDQDVAEQLQDLMEQDFDIGSTIRNKIIPHAVSWFTGEADQDEYKDTEKGGEIDDDEEEEDEDEYEEDEYEDEDEDEYEDEDEDEYEDEDEDEDENIQRSSQSIEQPHDCKQQ